MAKTLTGPVLFGTFKAHDKFNWSDPTSGLLKPILSFKVLVAHEDGTVSMESITLPPDYRTPQLEVGKAYGFPCSVRVNKKQKINWTARADLMPFAASQTA